MARDVPAFGYRTYYVASEGYLPQPDVSSGTSIENDSFVITVDPDAGGAITRVLDKRTGRVVNSGPWNDLVALAQDSERTSGGRELWTTGAVTRASGREAKVDRFRVEGMERLTVTLPFLGGTAVREVTLYEGLPYIFCETRLESIDANDTLVAVTLETDIESRAPIFGEGFGAIVGRFSPEPLVFRTHEMENPSGTGAQPSHQWVAVSPNDGIRLRDDTLVPFMPTAVVYGSSDFLLEDVAREVQQALARRGVPVDTWPDVLPKKPTGWTDSTRFASFDADLNHGTAFRILVGGPKHNALTQSLFRRLEKPVSELMEGQSRDDGITFWLDTGVSLDTDVPEGRLPVPTLVIAGPTVRRSVELASAFARSIASNGSYRFVETASTSKVGARIAQTGIALIHPGSMLSSVERDGTLFLGLLHGSAWEADADPLGVPSVNRVQRFQYVVYPFEGTWRQAGVPRVAESLNRSFTTVQTDLHLGQLARTFGFMTVSPPEWIVTRLAPSAVGLAGLRTKAVSPFEGILIRGYASSGGSLAGTVYFAAGIASAARTNLFGRPDATIIPDGNRIAFHASGFDITTLWIQPGRGLPRGPSEVLVSDRDLYGPAFTRYWRHNIGAAPMGNQPITVAIEGGSDSETQQVKVRVANNTRDEVAEGTVVLTAPPGWSLSPEEFAYNLNPGEQLERDALILRPEGDETGGGIVARTRFADRTYQDLWPPGRDEVEFSATWKRNEVLVTIRNRGAIPAEGFVDLVVSVAHWPELRPFAEALVTPRRATVYVPPFKEERILFRVSEGPLDFSLAAKLAVNGNVQYTRVSAAPE
ncbi:MAG: hypothetical protein IID08_06485 [Candidatus Hydrogenedentes bacterium]|nr:hypothetical protein [Candidatus Hydrogenedentota bacterium]